MGGQRGGECGACKRNGACSKEKRQRRITLLGIALIIFSIAGLIILNISGKYIIHPTLYLVTLLMGLGWTGSGITITKNKEDKNAR